MHAPTLANALNPVPFWENLRGISSRLRFSCILSHVFIMLALARFLRLSQESIERVAINPVSVHAESDAH